LRATRKRIEKISCAAEAIATRVGTSADEVKVRRKNADDLTDRGPPGNTCKPEAMSAAPDTHSAALFPVAARGPISLLIVSILPL
jgi:hypothetical protein